MEEEEKRIIALVVPGRAVDRMASFAATREWAGLGPRTRTGKLHFVLSIYCL